MFTTKSGAGFPAARWALGAQAAVVPAILVFCQSPAPGEAALYLPLHAASQAQSVAWTRNHGGRLLGRGPLPGSLLIQAEASGLALAAAADGALLLSVPNPLCGASAPSDKPVYR
ncbi:hypothetical protein WG901_06960 [Novosphingobium sp. PS1R-30]|uniref:Uncharacterized protein n=1 Tax=Novosphingobium anseongense TaxID=3133436 RepID=A0ABU8RTI4_9SPHN